MSKRYAATALLMAIFATVCAAQIKPTLRGTFYNKDYKITLRLDLTAESIKIPGLEFLGGTNGYISGGIVYNTWIVTDFKQDTDSSAMIRMINDYGADTQEMKLTKMRGDTFSLELRPPIVVKQAVKRKLVKVGPKYIFVKQTAAAKPVATQQKKQNNLR